jgi:hypothetical protein
MKAEAKKWAKRYQERGDFPEPKLIPVPPGSAIYLGEQNSIALMNMGMRFEQTPGSLVPDTVVVDTPPNRNQPRWYFYLVLQIEIETALNVDRGIASDQYHAHSDKFDTAYDAFACQYPWGALSTAINHRFFNTIDVVSQRINAVLLFWEQLDAMRYIDPVALRGKRGTLAELLAIHFEGPIGMWVDAPTGDVRQDLRTAIDQMNRASEEEIRVRMMRQLHSFLDRDRHLEHKEWLQTPGVLEAGLAHYQQRDRPGWYEELKSGSSFGHGYFLGRLDHKYPDGYPTTPESATPAPSIDQGKPIR